MQPLKIRKLLAELFAGDEMILGLVHSRACDAKGKRGNPDAPACKLGNGDTEAIILCAHERICRNTAAIERHRIGR